MLEFTYSPTDSRATCPLSRLHGLTSSILARQYKKPRKETPWLYTSTRNSSLKVSTRLLIFFTMCMTMYPIQESIAVEDVEGKLPQTKETPSHHKTTTNTHPPKGKFAGTSSYGLHHSAGDKDTMTRFLLRLDQILTSASAESKCARDSTKSLGLPLLSPLQPLANHQQANFVA